MEEKNNEKENDSKSVSSKQVYEYDNIKADKLTHISNILIFDIPIIIIALFYVCNSFLYGFIVLLINFICPLSIIIGLTLLVYIRIKYPDNVKSKKLVKTCIFAAIAIALLYAFLFFTCINIISNIKGCPG